MKFELVTLDGVKYSAKAYEVIVPTAAGEITILPGHESLLSVVTTGVITVRREKGDSEAHLEHYATYGGVLEVNPDSVRVLVDEATHGDDINEAETKKAYEAAIKLRGDAKNQVELDKAQQLVDRHAVRISVAQLRRRTRR
jgi:F-type H+-transporting ATPase subunit epsilon